MFPAEDILGNIWKRLKEDAVISADITAIQCLDFDKSVFTGVTLKGFMVKKCTTDDQCEPEQTDSDQLSPIIPTTRVCLQAIETIRQFIQTYDDDAQMHTNN